MAKRLQSWVSFNGISNRVHFVRHDALEAARIEMLGRRRSRTGLNDQGDVFECLHHWIVHLEQTQASPNTLRPYVCHVVDFANFLGANGAGVHEATVALYDGFLAWRLANRKHALPRPRLILPRQLETRVLGSSTRNQIQLAIKSFYRFYNGTDDFAVDTVEVNKAYDGHRFYKPFLEHINQRHTTRRKDRYLSGDPSRVQQQVLKKRLTPSEVLRLIEACGLARGAFLMVLLYNTGLRIGEPHRA